MNVGDHMMTQWHDVVEVIGVIFAGALAVLILVVYLEQWFDQPDLPPDAFGDEQALNKPVRSGVENCAPELSVQARAAYLPPLQLLASPLIRQQQRLNRPGPEGALITFRAENP